MDLPCGRRSRYVGQGPGVLVGLVVRAHEHGLAVPEDLAVITYDDEVAADPPLTAVRPQKHRLGVLAAEMALARAIEPVERPLHRAELWPNLIIRASCGGTAPVATGRDGDGGPLPTGLRPAPHPARRPWTREPCRTSVALGQVTLGGERYVGSGAGARGRGG
ncbi:MULTISPECIES: substrate-binding domain-containing protein [unclassified Streptomyces]|uniref:substrate-binding domain-containing protein n=1 Tax=unclassified Streptomyces TaxID=2593676 RepID=UPI001F35F361|nr:MULTISPECIES: substrate-binding domain-containing protein [unclassified Streptomyces]